MKKCIIDKFRYYLFEPKQRIKSEKIILIYHGWGGTVKGYADLAGELLREGYTAIVPEIVFHDTRQSLENHFDKKTMQDYFWKAITESIDEFNEFVTTTGLNKENIIVVGNSMGGLIANGIFAREPNLYGLVNINGSGSFVRTEHIFREKDNRGHIPLEEEKVLKEYDPIEKTKCESPILLMHGDLDELMPIEGQKDYYRFLNHIEKRSNVEFQVHSNVNHQFTLKMMNELIVWLNKISQK